jgi:hypothetical protein
MLLIHLHFYNSTDPINCILLFSFIALADSSLFYSALSLLFSRLLYSSLPGSSLLQCSVILVYFSLLLSYSLFQSVYSVQDCCNLLNFALTWKCIS